MKRSMLFAVVFWPATIVWGRRRNQQAGNHTPLKKICPKNWNATPRVDDYLAVARVSIPVIRKHAPKAKIILRTM